MKPTAPSLRRTRARVVSATAAGLLLAGWAAAMAAFGPVAGAVAGPAAPEAGMAGTDLPALDVHAVADRSSYGRGDAIVVTVTVANVGTAAAKNIRETSGGQSSAGQSNDTVGVNGIVWSDSPDAAGFATGFELAAGETATLSRHGTTDDWAYNHGQAVVEWAFQPDGPVATVADAESSVRLTVPVVGAAGDLTGVVCDGVQVEVVVCKYPQPGGPPAGVPDVAVTVLDPDGSGRPYAETTTDDTGHFTFHNIPVGTRSLQFVPPAGWQMASGPTYQVAVVRGGDANQYKLFVGARRDGDTWMPSAAEQQAAHGAVPAAGPRLEPSTQASAADPSAATDGAEERMGTGGQLRAAQPVAGASAMFSTGRVVVAAVTTALAALAIAGYLVYRRRRASYPSSGSQ